jgi:hypothetical protein
MGDVGGCFSVFDRLDEKGGEVERTPLSTPLPLQVPTATCLVGELQISSVGPRSPATTLIHHSLNPVLRISGGLC